MNKSGVSFLNVPSSGGSSMNSSYSNTPNAPNGPKELAMSHVCLPVTKN